MGLPRWAWVEKFDHGAETLWLSNKEKVTGVVFSKVDINSFPGYERIYYY